MGLTKSDVFSEEVNQISEVLKALGHPARISIILYLAERSDCVGSSIVNEIPLAQPTISRHLSELKKVGLIKGTISGKNISYCLNEPVWDEVKKFVLGIEIKKNTCC